MEDRGTEGYRVGYDRGAPVGQKIRFLCRDRARILCSFPDAEVDIKLVERLAGPPDIGTPTPRLDANKPTAPIPNSTSPASTVTMLHQKATAHPSSTSAAQLPQQATRPGRNDKPMNKSTQRTTQSGAATTTKLTPQATLLAPTTNTAQQSPPTARQSDYNTTATKPMKARPGLRLEASAEQQAAKSAPYARQPAPDDDAAPLAPPQGVTLPGNASGLCPGGCASPRTWFVWPGKPPHVGNLAWSALTPEVRQQQRRWILEIRAMPADLLEQDMAVGVIELIRRHAVARSWRWSTTSKALTTARGALLNLPLYTSELQGIDVARSPIWRSACMSARRFARETPPAPPPPVTQTDMRTAMRKLAHAPSAQAFLALMWALAGRAGDISGLACQDLLIGDAASEAKASITVKGEPQPHVLTPINVTFRRGKGTRFRGPYCVASWLRTTDAAILTKLLATKLPGDRLFQRNGATERNLVRKALRELNPQVALPSLRKGAARHLAEQDADMATIQALLGHTRADTTRRYLGYGQLMCAEDEIRRAQLQKLQ